MSATEMIDGLKRLNAAMPFAGERRVVCPQCGAKRKSLEIIGHRVTAFCFHCKVKCEPETERVN
jgi:hypothetical protein